MSFERYREFDFWGPRQLSGPELKVGEKAPSFTLVKDRGEEVTNQAFTGKPLLISVVPSLDTGVCSLQTRRFHQEIDKLGQQIAFITVSADLPFAQKRWCGAEGIQNLQVLSDHRDMSFGQAYGTYIKGLRFNSRAVFVVDREGTIRYVEYVPVAGQEPNYDAALSVLKQLS